MKQDGHFVSKKHRIERDSDNDTHDHDHDHHDDDHDHQENEVEPKQDDNHDDHDGHDHDHDHDHGSTKKKTWTTAQKWGYATLANTFLGKNHIILTFLVSFISYKLYDINHILWVFDLTHMIWTISHDLYNIGYIIKSTWY